MNYSINSIRLIFTLLAFMLAINCFVSTPVSATTYRFDYDFSTGDHGFVAGFSDYPEGEQPTYELTADHRPAPVEVGGADALYISGKNHSSDLFMYYKKKISGLQPNSSYQVDFELELASKAPFGSAGIGGSPAHSVYLKTGAVGFEPDNVVEGGYYRMNLDKGNQSKGGSDVFNIGDVAKPKTDPSFDTYAIIHRDSGDTTIFNATTDSAGNLWVLFGTDSGFEGTTSLYYTQFTVNLTGATIAGDVNEDGFVNQTDLNILLENYGSTSATFSMGDFDSDNQVGLSDLLLLKKNYLDAPDISSIESIVVVPEPGCFLLLLMGIIGLVGSCKGTKTNHE